MVYTAHDKLSIITLEKEQEVIYFDVLKALLREEPANVVYVELDGYLYGLFSTGSVTRARMDGRDAVRVRRKFTKVAPGEYMRALQIFHDKDTINAIPVVTPDGVLLGEYSRWNDSIVLAWQNPYSAPMLNSEYAREFWMNRPAILIKPCAVFDWKVKQFEYWKKYFEHIGAAVTVIEWAKAMDYYGPTNKNGIILCIDDDEIRVFKTFGKDNIYHYKICTYAECLRRFAPLESMMEADANNDFLKHIYENGVYVLKLTADPQDTSYYDRLSREIEDKYKSIGKESSCLFECELYPGFFAELYTPEYAKAIATLKFETMMTNDAYKLKDTQGPFLNVEDNQRKTVGQPKVFSQEVFFAGPCTIYGHYVEDQYTIESFLQKKLNDLNLSVCVRNLVVYPTVK